MGLEIKWRVIQMTKSNTRKHSPDFKVSVAIKGIKGEKTLFELAGK